MDAPLLLVTGANGFVAGHVIAELLAAEYRVRATVRNPSKVEDGLSSALPTHRVEFVEADLDDDVGWDVAMVGVSGVVHVASPAPKSVPRVPDEIIRPAVAGTRRVLAAASRAGVRRVVVTSSIDAVRGGHDARDGRERTEQDWSVIDHCSPYAASKTLAEQEAWRFARESDLEVVTICPGLVLGPLRGTRTNVSMDVIDQLLKRSLPALPHIGFAVVDVRDVATAHRLALEHGPAAGRRYIVAGRPVWLREIAEILSVEFAPRGYRIPLKEIPSPLIRAGALMNRSLRLALPLLDQPARVSSHRAQEELGWSARPLHETLIDAANSIIKHARTSVGETQT